MVVNQPGRGALSGRTAVVTGVSRRIGIGYALTSSLLRAGASVLAHSWSKHDADQPWGADPIGIDGVIESLRSAAPPGARLAHIEADLADPESPARVVADARRAFGHVDVLIANHARSGQQRLEELTAKELDTCWAANVRGTLLLVQAFAAQHDGRPGGRVIYFTSGQHLQPMPSELPYIATKGALQQLTMTLAAELNPRGITVNCVNPGPVDTGYADPRLRSELEARHPRGRWGMPADVARLVTWLVSDEADWITGQTVVSDGGFHLA